MNKFKTDIDKLVSRILEEEIQNKSKQLLEQIDEELKGNQKKLDVAEPKGKLTSADFKKLRSKKKETKEFFYDDESVEDAEEKSQDEPTYVGKGLGDNKVETDLENKMLDFDQKMKRAYLNDKLYGSFGDEHGWFDEKDNPFEGNFDFDYDEEVFPDFDSLMASPYAKKQNWFAPERKGSFTLGGSDGRKFFDLYQKKFGGKPFKIRKMKGLEEETETEEGNAFTGKLAHTKKGEKFKLGNKVYKDTSDLNEGKKEKKCPKCGMKNCKCNHKEETKESKKWIQKTEMKKGALHKKLGVPEGDKIPQSKLKSLKKELMKKGEGDKKLSASDSKLLKQVNLALTLKDIKESINSVRLTENELIDMIEKIVKEEQKSNIKQSEALGLKKTKKAQAGSKNENEQYQKEVTEKMKKYTKDTTKKDFEMNPESFPESNYTIGDMKEKTMKYHPSQAVDEYIDAFAYPGMTNLVYDEIKPNDEKIEKYLKGDSTTGNAVKDKDGKALGNVVPSEVGEKFMKNYEDNLYGAEQMNVSYKRQPQPVDVGGTEKMAGSLKSIRKSSTGKANKIMNQLESTEEKSKKKINEDIEKMKSLIGYSTKTQ